MNSGCHLMYDDVVACMEEAYSYVPKFCKHKINFSTDPRMDTGEIIADVMHPVGSAGYKGMLIVAGTKSLVDNMLSSGAVRDEDAVWCLAQVFHESAHAWQYSVGYMQKDASDTVKAMARDRAIGICFPEYTHVAYNLDTTELFADAHAVSCLGRFFARKAEHDSRFCDIDVDRIVCSRESGRRGNVFPRLLQCRTTEEVHAVYASGLNRMMYQKKFDVSGMIELPEQSKNLTNFFKSSTVLDVLNSPNGKEESDLLCKYIGKNHPYCMRGLICIQKDYGVLNLQNINERALRAVTGVRRQLYFDLPEISGTKDDEPEF